MGRPRGKKGRDKNKGKAGGKKTTQKHDGEEGDLESSTLPRFRTDDQYITTITRQGNFRMEAYYAAQGMHHHYWDETTQELKACETMEQYEAERRKWRQCLGEVLPASFRISKDVHPKLRDSLEEQLTAIMLQNEDAIAETTDNEGKGNYSSSSSTSIQKLGFLPHSYQLALDRASIRKKPEHAQLHQWLKQQSEAGFITRQETVSMIPPVVLNPRPSDSVIDLCAAPGSKTSQLLEALDSTGSLVANDASFARAHMLTTQLRRMMHFNPVALITHGQAQFFPNVVQFDQILADVPCSGDGTSRKNIDVWTRWSQLGALALHSLQFDIAWKGVSQLCRVGGYVCYSTCSFNPVENEAVVAELLRKAEGQLELVTVDHLRQSGFRTRPGLATWKVFGEDKSQRQRKNVEKKNNPKMQQRRQDWAERQAQQHQQSETCSAEHVLQSTADDPNLQASIDIDDAFTSQQEVDPTKLSDQNQEASDPPSAPAAEVNPEKEVRLFKPLSYDDDALIQLVESSGLKLYLSPDEVPEHLQRRIRQSCFPPSIEEAETFHLERCIRCLPHDNDTGGFFVALLHKKGPISSADRKQGTGTESESAEPSTAAENDDDASSPVLKRAKVDVPAEASEEAETANVASESLVGDTAAGDATLPPKRSKKRNLVRDAEGNAIEGLGRDDFVPVSEDIMAPLIDFYGLSSSFARDFLMIRAGGESKVVSYIAPSVKALFDAGFQQRVTVISSGLKVLIRKGQDAAVNYRLSQEGVHFLAPHMTKRKFVVDRADFEVCLSAEVVSLTELSMKLRELLLPLSAGSMLMVLEGYEDGDDKMMLAKWRCRGEKMDNLVPKVELQAMKDKLHALQSIEGHKIATATSIDGSVS